MGISTGSVNNLGQVMRRADIEARYQSTRELARVTTGLDSVDRLEISPAARDLEALRTRLQTQAMALPEVREDRVAQVRARMAEGYYQREDLVTDMANRLMAEAELRPTEQAPAASTQPAYREELMREVNDKIQSGFYTDGQVMNFVADRLMSIYNINSSEDE